MKYLLLLFLLGCKAEPIVTYRLSKEPSPEATAVGALPAAHREVDWVVPSGWEEQAPSQMRVGSFLIKSPEGKTVDISVVPLSGAAGGDLSNINRWRGQIQLSPIDEPGLRKEIEQVTLAGLPMRMVDFSNEGKRIVVAMYKQGEKSWFFKMMGDDALAKASKPAFLKFLSSLKFHDHE